MGLRLRACIVTPKERTKLITAIWRRRGPGYDFRSKRGDETHPSVLWYEPNVGTTLVLLAAAPDELLLQIWRDIAPKE